MDSERLKYFVSAAQCLNFSEVARNNYVSQPTISHQISMLERELGSELFSRQGKTLTLSKEGEFFLPLATRILADIEDAALELTRFRQGKEGRVSIFVAETCRVAFLRCLTEFSKRYPDILVDTEVEFRNTQTDILLGGDFDLFFVAEKMAKNSAKFDFLITHHDRLCLVLPAGVPEPDDMNDFSFLGDMAFIGLRATNSPMMQNDITRIFLLRNYSPRITNRCNRMEDALRSVANGVGFSILPLSIVRYYDNQSVHCVPFEDSELFVNCVAAWRRNNRNRSAAAFIEVVKSLFPQA